MMLIRHCRNTVEDLAKDYHFDGLWGSNLAGYCGIASRFLIKIAKFNHISNMKLVCGTFDGNTHCWVEYDSYCIDITISQFFPFYSKKYRICRTDEEFYLSHYVIDMKGAEAVANQKQWDNGQAYDEYKNLLWQIHKCKYTNECMSM